MRSLIEPKGARRETGPGRSQRSVSCGPGWSRTPSRPSSRPSTFFRNREGHRAKALLWDRTGWLLIYKRLENGVFHFPVGEDGVVEIDAGQLRMLLDGIELGVASRRKAL